MELVGPLVGVAAAAIHPAAIRLAATRSRRGRAALDRDGKTRELFFQLFRVALRTLRRLLSEEDGFKSVSAGFATILEDRHDSSVSDTMA